ncbi:hypothetical protein TNIN_95431 [Trichonephila inaurata madagascariensis]|uniref:Uncharacterized protein n=1 Tax=Trichonephila inaurata madagascariensis TaxID=2747483 RepID=A0A8X6YHS9_9ARAC|nr:hypothetical protein TNIN_95431 [Trichonephila inaurata madagascariensis]
MSERWPALQVSLRQKFAPRKNSLCESPHLLPQRKKKLSLFLLVNRDSIECQHGDAFQNVVNCLPIYAVKSHKGQVVSLNLLDVPSTHSMSSSTPSRCPPQNLKAKRKVDEAFDESMQNAWGLWARKQ